MAKSKKKNKKTIEKIQDNTNPKSLAFWHNPTWQLFGIALLAFVIYANSCLNEYALDDAIVIYDNEFVKQGIAGIDDIYANDSFHGFFKVGGKSNLVSGGRYRPFTMMMFAIEWQIFGDNPAVNHFINVLLYMLLGICIYKCLVLLIIGPQKAGQKERDLRMLIFLACLIFVAHPVHTEAVSNIKGRDEIMTMLGSVVALWASLKFYYQKNITWAITAMVSFFIALMSKENAITFLAVVPLAYLLFKRLNFFRSLSQIWPFFISSIAFIIVRISVIGFNFGDTSVELMNNPFLKIEGSSWVPFSGGEKFATIIYTLGSYLGLLVFPHPLSHDYYPRAVEIMQFSDWQVLLSLFLYLGMIALAFFFWKKDRIISFGIFFYLITLSIVSNIVFPIGTNMSERFLFMPSLGFALILARLGSKYIKNRNVLYGLMGLIIIAMSLKTIVRNNTWKDDLTLFTTDVKTQPNSAKLLNAAGGALSTTASKMEDGPERTKMLEEAVGYLEKAIDIHPTYKNAYLLLGNSNYYLKNYEPAISYLEKVLKMYPNFKDANKNLPIVLRDAGKHYGQVKNDLAKSESYLNKAYQLNSKDPETCRLLGIVNGMKGDHQNAIKYFKSSLDLNPKSASALVNLGFAYQQGGNLEEANNCFRKAEEIDPEALSKFRGN